MKADKKTIMWVVIGVVVVTGLVAVMVIQTGLLDSEPEVVPIGDVKVNTPTNTPEPEEGWWDEKPTPVSLN